MTASDGAKNTGKRILGVGGHEMTGQLAEAYSRFAEVYDEASAALAEETWRKGILSALTSSSPSPKCVLDLGCGTGIGGKLMSPMGVASLVGLDRSPQMLCRAKSYYNRVILGDILGQSLNRGTYDYIVSGFDTLNYLRPMQLKRALLQIGQRLRDKSSQIIFDYSSPALLEKKWRDLQYDEHLDGDRTLRWSHRFEASQYRTATSITFLSKGVECWTERHVQYAVRRDEIARFSKSAGLIVVEARDLNTASYSDESFTHVYTLGTDKP